jgi:4-hydroxythreonine-4-phosphate dehydrogenase
VLGSYSEPAARQRAVLARSPEVDTVALSAPYGADQRRAAAAELAGSGRDILLIPDPGAAVDRDRAGEVASALGAVAAELLRERHGRLGGLLLTGGETARAVLLAIGVNGFIVLGELAPGVVLGTLPTLGGLPVVTKAGAFGDQTTLDLARRALHDHTVLPPQPHRRPDTQAPARK